MIRYVIITLLFVFGRSLFAAPTVSNVRVDQITHSSFRVTWDITGAAVDWHRIRYGTTTAYEGSTYGGIIYPGAGNGTDDIGYLNTDVQWTMSGMRYSTLYHFCPQSSDDGGSTWSTCTDNTTTTSALPVVHPALPIAPINTVSTTMPDTTGYLLINDVAADCSNLSTKLQAAETARTTTGAILVWPTNCTVTNLFFPDAGDASSDSSKWALIVPEWPLGVAFTTPIGTRVTSASAGLHKMTLGTIGALNQVFYISGLHHWRIIGIEVTTGNTVEDMTTTTDPTPWGAFAQVYNVDHFIFDRMYWHAQVAPDRILRGVYLTGKYVAFVESEMSDVAVWKSGRGLTNAADGGLSATLTSSTVITISAGDYYLGNSTCTFVSPMTATITAGSVSGTIYIYVDMSCVMTVSVPTGLSVTCSGCTAITSATPTLPTNGSLNRAFGGIAYGTLTSGAWISVTNDWASLNNYGLSAYAFEGPTGLLLLCGGGKAITGPGGPFLVRNNKFEVEDIAFHSDDTCDGSTGAVDYQKTGADFQILSNLFTLKPSWYMRDAAYNHRRYTHRNHIEFKTGIRAQVYNNTCENSWTGGPTNAPGACVVITPTKGTPNRPGIIYQLMGDFDIQTNIIQNQSACNLIQGGREANGTGPVVPRFLYHNNFCQTAARYESGTGSTRVNPGIMTRGAMEDFTITHNTFLLDGPSSGAAAQWWYQIHSPIEGVKIENNILSTSDYSTRLGTFNEPNGDPTPNCSSLTGILMLNCGITSGTGTPGYTFLGNLLVPYTGAVVSSWTTAYAGSTVVPGATAAARIALVGCSQASGNWRCVIPIGSIYRGTATDGSNPGVLWGYDTGAIFGGKYSSSGKIQ